MSTPVPPAGGAPVFVRPCPVCATPVSADALFCPACGTTLQRRRGPDAALLTAGVLTIVVGVLLAVLLTRNDTGTVATTGTTTAVTATTAPPATTIAPPAATTTTPPPATATPAPPATVPPATTPAPPPTATITPPATGTTPTTPAPGP